jgi:hypothetical protein
LTAAGAPAARWALRVLLGSGRIVAGRRRDGAIAQLGERLLCKQEVVGSIPSGSTIRSLGSVGELAAHEAVSDPSRSVGIFDIVKIGICLAASFRGGCRAKRPARLDRIAVQANPAQELVFLVNDIRIQPAE